MGEMQHLPGQSRRWPRLVQRLGPQASNLNQNLTEARNIMEMVLLVGLCIITVAIISMEADIGNGR